MFFNTSFFFSSILLVARSALDFYSCLFLMTNPLVTTKPIYCKKKQSQLRVISYSENGDLGLENAVQGRKRRSQFLLCGNRSWQITAF